MTLQELRADCEKPLVLQLGCGKSGTVSLRRALDTLGYRAVHDHGGLCTDVSRALLNGEIPESFGDYDAFCDVPKRMLVLSSLSLPDDVDWRVIFTSRRDVEAWITSYLIHVLHNRVCKPDDIFQDISTHEHREWYADAHRRADEFERLHPGRLLRFDVSSGDGWPELCAFLGEPVPDEEFPGLHAGNEKLQAILDKRGGV